MRQATIGCYLDICIRLSPLSLHPCVLSEIESHWRFISENIIIERHVVEELLTASDGGDFNSTDMIFVFRTPHSPHSRSLTQIDSDTCFFSL
jgi:hypothetical protein